MSLFTKLKLGQLQIGKNDGVSAGLRVLTDLLIQLRVFDLKHWALGILPALLVFRTLLDDCEVDKRVETLGRLSAVL